MPRCIVKCHFVLHPFMLRHFITKTIKLHVSSSNRNILIGNFHLIKIESIVSFSKRVHKGKHFLHLAAPSLYNIFCSPKVLTPESSGSWRLLILKVTKFTVALQYILQYSLHTEADRTMVYNLLVHRFKPIHSGKSQAYQWVNEHTCSISQSLT